MKKFKIKTYSINNKKLQKNTSLKLALIADLHGFSYGNQNQDLLNAILAAGPDIVCVAGDMMVRYDTESEHVAEHFLNALADIFPVFYSMGNHESKMYPMAVGSKDHLERSAYETRLLERGIHILRNQTEYISVQEQTIALSGLELPLSTFKKPHPPAYTLQDINMCLENTVAPELFHVLLAHTPKYMNVYYEWGADLIMSGHYHGGVMRFSENLGAISPQFEIFPRYCCGLFENKSQYGVVSPGLGVHTIPLRIHNPAELIIIEVNNK